VTEKHPLLIIGAKNLVAPYLFKRLRERGQIAEVISRSAVPVPEGFTLTQMDLTHARNWIAPEGAVVVSLIPLWVLAQMLPRFIGVKAIVAVGSTSVFSKAASASERERQTAADLDRAEQAIRVWCARDNVCYTLLRPTMVYDGQSDRNIARMAHFIRRFRFLPLATPAKGLRQPIHADDVAGAILAVIDNFVACNKTLNIAGGEVLTYRAMAERVFAAMGKKPRFVMLPAAWLMRAFRVMEALGLLREKSFGSAIFQRMNEDLVFDDTEGMSILNYQPRDFRPEVKG